MQLIERFFFILLILLTGCNPSLVRTLFFLARPGQFRAPQTLTYDIYCKASNCIPGTQKRFPL